MKIAITTDDDDIVNTRFGCAYYFQVFTLENGQVIKRELVDKHAHLTKEGCVEHCERPICFTAEFMDSLKAYDIIVSGGISRRPWEMLVDHNISLTLTSLPTVDAVLAAYKDGTLTHDPSLIRR
ncbi:MAG TPA: NifB/NifX family molybdenum-iron cluster-binding protein [Bellilinea sp.]|nr:NifB/NifX family molybdenum-iron cluster-binding protein [Bellilinea sp.]